MTTRSPRSLGPPLRVLRVARAFAAVALAVVLVGCSSTPDGWEEVTLDGLTFARPGAMAATTAELGEQVWLHEARAEEGRADLEVLATGRLGPDRYAASAVDGLVARYQVQVQGFTLGDRRDVEIEGATSAQLVSFRFDDADGGRRDGRWIVAANVRGHSAAIEVSAIDLEETVVEGLLDSAILTPTEQPDDATETTST